MTKKDDRALYVNYTLRSFDYILALLEHPCNAEITSIIKNASESLIEYISVASTFKTKSPTLELEGFGYEINNKLAVLYEWVDEIAVYSRHHISVYLVKAHLMGLKKCFESLCTTNQQSTKNSDDSGYGTLKSGNGDIQRENYGSVFRQLSGSLGTYSGFSCIGLGLSVDGDMYATSKQRYANASEMDCEKLAVGCYVIPNTKLVKEECNIKYLAKDAINKIMAFSEDLINIKSAPTNAIIGLAIIADSASNDFLSTFKMCYRNFISSYKLIEILQMQYFVSLDSCRSKLHDDVCNKILNFITSIFESIVLYEIEADLVKLVANFTHTLIFFGRIREAKRIRDVFKVKILDPFFQTSEQNLNEFNHSNSPSASGKHGTKKLTHCENLLDFHSLDIAKQITCGDWNLFHGITPVDIYEWIYSENENMAHIPKVAYLLGTFKATSLWCERLILCEKNENLCVKLITKFMKIANVHLCELFQYLLAILHSLNSHKIKKIDLPSNIRRKLETMTQSIGYPWFREYGPMAEFCGSQAAVPHFGVILYEVNKLNGEISSGVCNFANCRTQQQIFAALDLMQNQQYDFVENERLKDFLRELNPTTFTNI